MKSQHPLFMCRYSLLQMHDPLAPWEQASDCRLLATLLLLVGTGTHERNGQWTEFKNDLSRAMALMSGQSLARHFWSAAAVTSTC
jgi:hypothetical protein